MLNSVTDLNVIEKYYAKFAKKYSKRYFVIYGKALENSSDQSQEKITTSAYLSTSPR